MSISDSTFGNISISTNQLNIDWTIKDAHDVFSRKKVGEFVCSPPIIDGDLTWYICFYPTGISEETKSYSAVYVGLYKECITNNYCFTAKLELYIQNSKNNNALNLQSGTFPFILSQDPRYPEFADGMFACNGWPNFVPIKDLEINFFKQYISHNGDFSIKCKIYKKFKNYVTDATNLRKPLDCYNCNQFYSVLNNEILSDVELIVEGVKYFAHKVMLAAKSPIFMAIFDKDKIKDNVQKHSIQINDLKNDAVREMLRYIYVGKVEDIGEIAPDLLIAASKYDVKDLKKLCEEELSKRINLGNCIDVIIFAEYNNAGYLKMEAINFTAKNIEVLLHTQGWSKLIENKDLATQVFSAKYGSSK